MGHTKNKIVPNNTQYHTIYTIAQNIHNSKCKIDTIAHNIHNSMKPNTKYTQQHETQYKIAPNSKYKIYTIAHNIHNNKTGEKKILLKFCV